MKPALLRTNIPHKFFLLFLLFSGVLLLQGCSRISWSYYYSPEAQLRIKYPQDWIFHDNIPKAVVAFVRPQKNGAREGGIQENVNIIIDDLSEKRETLAQFTESMIKHTKVILPGAEFLQSGDTKMGRHPAYKIVYKLRSQKNQLTFLQAWTIVNGKAYIITGMSASADFESFEKILKEMLKSFEIV